MHEPHTLGQMLLAVLRRSERPLEVVDDRQQFADQAAPCPLTRRRGLPGNALPVVLEIGLDALRQREVILGLVVDDALFLVCGVFLARGLARLVA